MTRLQAKIQTNEIRENLKRYLSAATDLLTWKQFTRAEKIRGADLSFQCQIDAYAKVSKSEKIHGLLQEAQALLTQLNKPVLTIVENEPETKEEKMKASSLAVTKGLVNDSTNLQVADVIYSILQAYSDCCDIDGERDLGFKASMALDAETASSVLAVAVPDGYNAFDSSVFAEVVEAFPKATFTIAREGSVCVYVNLGTRVWLSRGVQPFLKVDELSVETDGTLRLWWD